MKKVAVFCGARTGNDPIYAEAAAALGRELAARGLTLVYGGGNVGLMGEVAKGALDAGGEVIGVIPEFMALRELAYAACTDLIVVDSMHTRKAKMAELADAFIALPGGLGTFDELFEILTWAQIGLHGKPIGLLNTQGYYDGLLVFLNKVAADGFVREAELEAVQVSDDIGALIDLLAARPQHAGEWQYDALRDRS
ncbi:LOG family protein [Chitinilyticum piscinae]|uniref:Cytokinin riboside 5'-monophosphate phosphoribohydrolase n=1 Tax=Chitinilyticum piscinae TaxID=2866724 RepID=A0A8J7FM82_9NEIS|nr:TIGR00730 family Rossman fold protein [Chitinilyticum piscinae]MBE9610697.1 TIGR00730 family Rossman fold protein [Chitinilyticum piscinae]